MTNKIQLRRDTAANWTRVNPILDDGEPGLNITTNQVKYGDGSTAWLDLAYASGGGGLTDVNGVVAFPGDLLIGTLWPEDPINGMGGDKESVVWAKDDTEYLGLWWGGDQTYPNPQYGPVAGIMIGAYDRMTDDFTNDPSPADTNITIGINDSTGTTLEWRFDRDGMFTLPQGGTISEVPAAETVTLDQLTDISSWTGTLVFTKNGAIYQALPNGPIIRLVGSTWLIQYATTSWFSSTDLITWVVGPYAGTTPPVGTLSVATTNLTVGANAWTFGADGTLTLPTGGHIGPSGGKGEGTTYGGANDHLVSLTSYYDSGLYSSCVTAYANGTLYITAYNDGGPNPAKIWEFANNGNLTFPDTTAQTTAFNITKFGEGFSLNGADKIVTNKLYSTNASSPTQHYRLELDTNGVVVLPDQSIINGSTIRGIYGTGELNYTGITIGPDTNHREESWMYVDHTGSYIATQYNTNQKLWQFKNDGSTILPSGAGFVKGDNGQLKVNDSITLALDFRDTSGRGFYTNSDGSSLRGNGSNTWLFGTNGTLTLPGGSAIGYTPSVSTNITVNAKTWAFGVDGNLTIPGEIKSAASTGPVTIQASDGNNPRNFVFNTDGSISLPHLASGSQGVGSFDARNNLIALNIGDTVNFANFSGMILVNTHNLGGVSLYLCGGGAGNAVAIGDSKPGNSVGSMAVNGSIGGYTFTADETGNHVFCAIRTRSIG